MSLKIAPATPLQPDNKHKTSSAIRPATHECNRLLGFMSLYRAWLSTQLTNFGGKYSIERMLALEEYSRNTSLIRVLSIVFGTPLPVAVIAIAQESIPLQSPSEGWSANYGFWIRFGVLSAVIAFSSAVHARCMVDGAALSPRQLMFFCTCTAIGYTAGDMAVAACWVFPVPFVTITLSAVVIFVMVGLFRAIVGAQAFNEIARRRDQLNQFNKFASVQIFMTMIYPAYQLLFRAVAATPWELPVLLMLPAIKLVMKIVLARTIAHKEDMIPQSVIFTIDFFDALYLATCIQNVTSITTVAVIMSVDLLQTAIELHDLNQRTEHVLQRVHQVVGSDANLLTAVELLCRFSETFKSQIPMDISVRSCISHRVSPEGRALLQKLETYVLVPPASSVSPAPNFPSKQLAGLSLTPEPVARKQLYSSVSRGGKAAQEKMTVISVRANVPNLKESSSRTQMARLSALQEALEVLFTAECLVLTEYLETVVPILYASFIVVMVHLPSAEFHEEMEGVTRENVTGTTQSVFIYAMLELLSFVVLAVIMKRNCGIQALYHLAFVLETQMSLVQSTMVLWVLMTLTYRVAHFGADFSFQFKWM